MADGDVLKKSGGHQTFGPGFNGGTITEPLEIALAADAVGLKVTAATEGSANLAEFTASNPADSTALDSAGRWRGERFYWLGTAARPSEMDLPSGASMTFGNDDTGDPILKVTAGDPDTVEVNGETVVSASRTVTAGAGLTGGGDLSADRTLAVDFGSAAGTVAEGDDVRLSDVRTPTAHAASHENGGDDEIDATGLAGIPTTAADLAYDHTSSGLAATDVQAAIDEVAGAVLDYHEETTATPFDTLGDVIITGNPIVLDGSTAISIEWSANAALDAIDGQIAYAFTLHDGETEIGILADGDFASTPGGSLPIYIRTPPFTPSAGSHTYSVRDGLGGMTGQVQAGAGGVGQPFPTYLRVSRA